VSPAQPGASLVLSYACIFDPILHLFIPTASPLWVCVMNHLPPSLFRPIPTSCAYICSYYASSDILHLPPINEPSTFDLPMFDRPTSKGLSHSWPLLIGHIFITLGIYATSTSIGSANLIPKVNQTTMDPELG
jgi:hypothetical protein